MDHDTHPSDADTLMAEVDALLQQAAATDARVDALLDGWAPRPTADTGAAMRRLQRTARHTARLTALVEQQQAVLAAQLDDMEAG